MNNIGRLIVSEVRIFWIGYICSMLFFALYSLLFGVVLREALEGDTEASIIVDTIILLFGQILGIGFTKFTLMNLYRTDPYTRKIRVIRRLPVRTSDIAIARVTLMLVLTAVNTIMLIVPAYLIMTNLQQLLTLTELCIFILYIFLFGSVAGSLHLYLKIGYRGRRYAEFYTVLIVLTILAIYLIWLFDIQLTVSLIEQAQAGFHPLTYIVALLATGLMVYIFIRIISRRLERRDYT